MSSSSSDSSVHDSLLESFCALTGMGNLSANNREFATSFLEGHQWNIEAAVNAYLEMKADGNMNAPADEVEHIPIEEQVRAPLPDKVDQLYDDSHSRHETLLHSLVQSRIASSIAASASRVTRGAVGGMLAAAAATGFIPTMSATPATDPFRNFANEAKQSTRSTQAQTKHDARLSTLFSPPDKLIYVSPTNDSSFEAALAHALAVKKWLIVNIQQGDQFSSHQLNRDVWNKPEFHRLISDNFVFCQLTHNSISGVRYISLYHPPSCPTVSIIDPLTRQKMWDIHSAGGSEITVNKKLVKTIEATLKQFAERNDLTIDGSDHPTANEDEQEMNAAIQASLSSSPKRSSKSASSAPLGGASNPIDLDDDDDNDNASEEYVEVCDSDVEPITLDEDSDFHTTTTNSQQQQQQQQHAAIDSTKQAGVKRRYEQEGEKQGSSKAPRLTSVPSSTHPNGTSSSTSSSSSTVDSYSLPSPSSSSPSAVDFLAGLIVPPEPVAAPDVCRLQIRLPTGRPAQRRFNKNQPIKFVYAFTRSLLDPDLQSKKFLLVSALPRRELTDLEMSIVDHGVANSSVILEWE